MSKGDVDGGDLAGALAFPKAVFVFGVLGLVARRVDVDSGFGVLDLLAAHQMVLVEVLTNVNQIVGLIQAIDVDDLHSQLLDNIVLWLSVESNTLAHWQIVADTALELVINHKVDEEV